LRRILVINPIADDRWNQADGDYLQSTARKDTIVDIVNIEKGASSIESFYDEAHAVPGVLKVIRENKDRYDGIMINCFADPGLNPAREICEIPVAGPGESAMIVASMLGHRFSIISVLKNVVPMFEMKAAVMGLSKRLASVKYIDVPVLALENNPDTTVESIVEKINEAVEKDSAEVAVLGCTGMLSLYRKVKDKAGIPVVEPAAASLKILETLIDLGISHSKKGLYLTPVFKKITW